MEALSIGRRRGSAAFDNGSSSPQSPARSQDRPQFHPCEALVEPRIRAQVVPLRRDREMNYRKVARVDQALKMLEGRVEVSSLCALHREEQSLIAKFELCAICQQLTRALEITHLPIRGREHLTSCQMLWIAIE